MKLFLLLLVFPLMASAKVIPELSGNLEGQFRQTNNNTEAKDDLFQNWNNENFYLIYGNLNGKVEKDHSRIEANWFVRYSYSELYEPNPPYFATKIFTFPNELVARDLFKLQHKEQNGKEQVESILNKFYYEIDLGQKRMMLGRMYINYGLGEIFNPINPFNQPTGLTSISQVAQGNDGVSYTQFLNDSHSIQMLFLGDKSRNNYEGDIDTTFWLHGEIQYSGDLQWDYVLGKDQDRYKLGGQISYQTSRGMIFSQLLYRSETTDNKPSHNLWDFLLGYDQQLTSKWHLRFEGGYQKEDRSLNLTNLGERFLPTEYFLALANVYEIHPLVKVSATLINDIKSGFSYFIGKSTYDVGHNLEADAFIFTPISKGDDVDNVAQKLVTTDFGVALRLFF